MLPYTLKRLLGAFPTLLILITLAFFMMRLAPGGPFDSDRALSPAVEANLQAAYNMDAPLYGQYLDYLGGLIRGDLGPSFQYPDRSVTEVIAQGMPVSLTLGALAIIVASLFGIAAGVFAALNRDRLADHALMALAMTGISVPNFVVAPILILVFALAWQLLPAGGWSGGGWRHLILPVAVLALPPFAYVARITRASMLDVLAGEFVRTARAKGLSGARVVWGHALRPALVPVVSYLGPAVAAVVTGSVVIEQIFGLPGLGRYFIQGGLNRDYTLVMGVVIFYGSLIILMNLIVDLLYAWIDPRVRYR